MLKKIGLGLLTTLIVAGVLGVGVIAAQGDVPWSRDGFQPSFSGRPEGLRPGAVMRGGMADKRGPQLEILAEALGLSADEVKAALQEGQTVAELAEEQGVELESVVDAVLAAAEEKFDEHLVVLEEKLLEHFTSGFPRPPQSGRGGRADKRGPQLGILAEALGLSADEVKAALQAGQTVAELAAEQGVELESVVDVVLAEAEEKLMQAVDAGHLTAEEVDEKLVQLEEHIREHFTEGFPIPPQGRRRPRPGRCPRF